MKRAWLLALPAIACAAILGFKKPGPHPFEHRAHVLKGVACVQCHEEQKIPTDATCTSCHTKPHDDRPCRTCHGTPGTDERLADDARHLRFQHARHEQFVGTGRCVTCHSGVEGDGTRLSPTMATCLGCHQHKDQFAVRDCNGCHVDVSTENVQPSDHIVHDGDFLREHGVRAAAAGDLCTTCHQERFCTGCHGVKVPGLPSTLRFDEPMIAGMHRAGFRERHPDEARAEPGLCASCHEPQTFCVSCHAQNGIAGLDRSSPHPPGWVGAGTANDHGPAARRDPVACASCHGGAGESLCVTCHKIGGVGGNPHPPGFSSSLPLTAMPCRMCHRP